MTVPELSAYERPPIREVRGLGKTWHKRRFAYWRKRAFAAFFILLGFAFTIWFAATIFYVAATETDSGFRVFCLTALSLALSWNLFTGLRAFTRYRKSMKSGVPISLAEAHKPSASRSGGTGGLGLGVSALGGSVVAGAFVVIGSVFVVGWMVVMVLIAFGRYLNEDELKAVQEAWKWYDAHPEIPNDQRPKQFRRR
ncbi:hypothetical protein [Nocardia sp. NPDC051570]|uniref:hypothetical protein n=1 Tax=Nocardia sp. NPDC051570 TaxID=3364324 RepID=UPI0037AE2AE8